MSGRRAVPARAWYIRFESAGRGPSTFLYTEGQGGETERFNIVDAFRAVVRALMAEGGCRSFTVGVHEDGPECDHETGGGGGNAA